MSEIFIFPARGNDNLTSDLPVALKRTFVWGPPTHWAESRVRGVSAWSTCQRLRRRLLTVVLPPRCVINEVDHIGSAGFARDSRQSAGRKKHSHLHSNIQQMRLCRCTWISVNLWMFLILWKRNWLQFTWISWTPSFSTHSANGHQKRHNSMHPHFWRWRNSKLSESDRGSCTLGFTSCTPNLSVCWRTRIWSRTFLARQIEISHRRDYQSVCRRLKLQCSHREAPLSPGYKFTSSSLTNWPSSQMRMSSRLWRTLLPDHPIVCNQTQTARRSFQ